MRLIDADELEKDGWKMHRIVRVEKDTMSYQTKKPTDFTTIEPERKTGKWIDDGTEFGCCCDSCGVTLDDYFMGDLFEVHLHKIPNYCPNCGADMRGKTNESDRWGRIKEVD